MDRTSWAMYLWPGFLQLWKRGTWSGLGLAVGFAALVNLGLLSSLVWSELYSPGFRNITWLAAASVWVFSAVFSYAWDRRHPERQAPPSEDKFGEALDHYLRQNWFEAERILRRLLRQNARDLDARLMLATLLRRSDRLDEAAGQLDRLRRMEGSQKWELEIGRERQLLAEAAVAVEGSAKPHERPVETKQAA